MTHTITPWIYRNGKGLWTTPTCKQATAGVVYYNIMSNSGAWFISDLFMGKTLQCGWKYVDIIYLLILSSGFKVFSLKSSFELVWMSTSSYAKGRVIWWVLVNCVIGEYCTIWFKALSRYLTLRLLSAGSCFLFPSSSQKHNSFFSLRWNTYHALRDVTSVVLELAFKNTSKNYFFLF